MREGEHLEGAVVNVTAPFPVRTFTWIPTVRPAEHGTQIFINHPQASELLRRQAALFLIDRAPWLELRPNEETAYEVHFEGRQASVERLQ